MSDQNDQSSKAPRRLPFWFTATGVEDLQPSMLQTSFVRVSENGFGGYVVNRADLGRRYVVELLIDGFPHRMARADTYVEELGKALIGDGCYGFYFTLPPATLGDGYIAEARFANSTTRLGRPIDLRSFSIPGTDPRGNGAVRWLGNLRFDGWCAAEDGASPSISGIIDGETIATAALSRWTHIGDAENAHGVRAFDFYLPQRFADGRVHRVRFVRDDGQEIAGSPATFVAYPDGLAATLARLDETGAERLRGVLYDKIIPASVPFSCYREWQERFPISVETRAKPSIAIALIGEGDEQATVRSIEAQGYPDWVAAPLPSGTEAMEFDPGTLKEFLTGEASECDFVLFLLIGTKLARHALQRIADAFVTFPEAASLYADFDIEAPDRALWPLAFSAFDYERMLEQGYCCHLFAMPRTAVEQAIEVGASNLYRVFNSQFDKTLALQDLVVHLPGPLATLSHFDLILSAKLLLAASDAHLAAREIKATTVPGSGEVLPAVRVSRTPEDRSISIVIPARGSAADLRACLESIEPAATEARAEIVVVDSGSSDSDMSAYLKQIDQHQALVLRAPAQSSLSQIFNIAARKLDSAELLLLESHVEATDKDWLNEMRSRLAEADVGVVGGLLVWPTHIIQHGGIVLGLGFSAEEAFEDRTVDDPGYADLLKIAHQCSAVSSACMLVSRKDYLAVGGMDELYFAEAFGDIDLCLKLRASSKRVIFSPYAKLISKHAIARERDPRFKRALTSLRARWGDALGDDPFYNPMLSLDSVPFSALAWPPRDRRGRLLTNPTPASIPPGF